MHYARFTYL